MQLNLSWINFADLDNYTESWCKTLICHLATLQPSTRYTISCDSLGLLLNLLLCSFLTHPDIENKTDSSRSLLRVSFLTTTPSEGVSTILNQQFSDVELSKEMYICTLCSLHNVPKQFH